MKYIFIIIFFMTSSIVFGNSSFFNDTNLKNKDLQKGISFYQNLEFDKAIKIFKKIIKKTNNRLEKATCFKYLAFTYTLKQNDDKSELYYSKLFEIYPDFELDYATVTPKISNYFKDYHETWLRTPGIKSKIYLLNTKKITYNAGINLKVEWHDPNLNIGSVILKYKQDGEKKYSQIEIKDIVAKNYITSFNLSFLNDPTIDFKLDYYLELYDTDGKLLYKIKDEKSPATVEINVPGGSLNDYEGSSTKAWYKSGWFITTVAIITIAAIGGGAYYMLSNTKEGAPDEAQINIYITNGN